MPKDNFYLSHLKQSEKETNKDFIDSIQSRRDLSAELWEEIEKAINRLDISEERKKSILELINLYPQMMDHCLNCWDQCNKLRHQETLNSYSGLTLRQQKELSLTFMKEFNPAFSQ